MPKSTRQDRQNPVFARPQTGIATNHSSSVPSTDHAMEADHAQFDDEIQDVTPPEDPNISGMTATEDCYTWLAGPISGWRENDDYRQFFENSIGPDSRLVPDDNDHDYDDNGQHPTGIGHRYGQHGPAIDETKNTSSSAGISEGFSIGSVIVRRI